jgi:hypothetical protein
VPMTGTTMLTIAHTNAAMASDSTRGGAPQPPAPPVPPAPVGSGSGPTGTALESSGFQPSGSPGGSEADIRKPYRQTQQTAAGTGLNLRVAARQIARSGAPVPQFWRARRLVEVDAEIR